MTLREILITKGTEVYCTSPDATLKQVTELLVEHNCGALVVVREDSDRPLVGIITERDLMRASAGGQSLEHTRADEVMTQDVVTGLPDDSVNRTMGVMTDRRIRHLPILDEDQLVGLISIGDVVKAQFNALCAENHHLKTYIHG